MPRPATLGTLTALSAAFYIGATFYAGITPWDVGLPGDTSGLSEAKIEELQEEWKNELKHKRETRRQTMPLSVVILVLTGAGFWGGNSLIRTRLRALSEDQERVIRTEKLNAAALLASSVAHELKNPLAIMNNAAFILRRGETGLDGKLRKQIGIIDGEIKRSVKIIDDLLGYVKLADGKIDSIDVNRLLDEAIEDLSNEIEDRRVVVVKSYRRHLPPLLIDRTQLRTLVSNLLLNACEAIDSLGKITVTTGYSDDGFIEISIADTGTGISEENLPKVFDSFFTTKSAGTGLGLSIVNSIAKGYGGTVEAESQENKGSCFITRLPTRTVRPPH